MIKRKIIKRILGDSLVKGSLTLFILINFFNLLNFIFHSASSRLLGPKDYGILAALMGMIYIFSIFSNSIQTIVSKFSTKLKEGNKIKNLFSVSVNRFLILGISVFLILFIFSKILSSQLKIQTSLIIFTGMTIIFYCLLPITRGILQGTKRFATLGTNFIIEGTLKLIVAIMLILIGLKVYGAITAIILSLAIAFLFSLYNIKDILKVKREKGKVDGLFSYSIPTLVSIACVALFYSIDVILVKIFFDAETAGIYAIISILGKIIIFSTMPVAQAMFPITSEKHENNKNSKDILIKTLGIVFFISTIAVFIFYLFPELIIRIFSGPNYLKLAHLLVYTGIAMAFLSLVNIFVFYNLSTNREKFNYLLIGFVILEIILLSIFNSTIQQFIFVIILIHLFMLIVFCIESLLNNSYFKSEIN